MIDPTTLTPGQKVRVWVTAGPVVVAEVTKEKHHGWAVLRVVEPADWPPTLFLKDGDYIVREIL